MTLVVLDADVLGRQRTGDETYVENLLRELPAAGGDLRLAALTRRPDLVPDGVEAVALPSRSQELRMAWSVPRALDRLRPALAHFQHALPLRCPCPAVVTIHDLSFERDATVMSRLDRSIFRRMVPRAARRAARVIVVSERTKADIVDLYGVAPEKIVVTPHGVDRSLRPRRRRAWLVPSARGRDPGDGRTRSQRSTRRTRPAFGSSPSGRSATAGSPTSSHGVARTSVATWRRTSSRSSTAALRVS